MRDWITARIEDDDGIEQVVSVANIQQLIATRAHSAASRPAATQVSQLIVPRGMGTNGWPCLAG